MLLILGNTIAMGVRERTHEYGVLRAIGFLPGHIARSSSARPSCSGSWSAAVGLALRTRSSSSGIGRFLEENMGAWFPYFRIGRETAVLAVGARRRPGRVGRDHPGAARSPTRRHRRAPEGRLRRLRR